jgi:hypothetical protein
MQQLLAILSAVPAWLLRCPCHKIIAGMLFFALAAAILLNH